MIQYIILLCQLHLTYCYYNENINLKLTKSLHQTLFKFAFGQNITYFKKSSYINYGYLPSNLVDILTKYDIEQLEISFSQSKWNTELWGPPLLDVPPGIMIYSKFRLGPADLYGTDGDLRIESKWQTLLNQLSGMFCTSVGTSALHYTIDPGPDDILTASPTRRMYSSTSGSSSHAYASRLAILPHETMCTENLSPWKKMLPCKNEAGLIRLLDEIVWFSKPFVSLRIKATSVPISNSANDPTHDTSSYAIWFNSTLTLLGRLNRPKLNPSSAVGVETLLKELYGRNTRYICPLAQTTALNFYDPSEMEPSKIIASINLNDTADPLTGAKVLGHMLKVSGRRTEFRLDKERQASTLFIDRYIAGYGRYKGTLVTRISRTDGIFRVFNTHLQYSQILPCHISVLVHTLKVLATTANGTVFEFEDYGLTYKPGKKKSRGSSADRGQSAGDRLHASANSASVLKLNFNGRHGEAITNIRLTMQFRFKLLPWYEYPPDSNHGFYLPSGVLHIHEQQLSPKGYVTSTTLYDQPLLLILPTPDFSMPYNVLCLSCTLLALSYGSIFNLTSKIMCFKKSKDSKSKLSALIKALRSKLGLTSWNGNHGISSPEIQETKNDSNN